MVSPRPNLRQPTTSFRSLVSRDKLPFERKNKKQIILTQYLRPRPPKLRARLEAYNRMKHGLFDLDRIMPPLWEPQEEFKIDQDEWMFKLLYFVHPITEEDLLDKAEAFPHFPFANRKEAVLSLERLVSREYARRVVGKKIRHPNVDPDTYYWTLMPDELAFGEKVVVEEAYMQKMREGKALNDPMFPIRKEMVTRKYQEKHNSYMHFDQCFNIEKLQKFVEFCEGEQKRVEGLLEAIGLDDKFPPKDDEERDDTVYPDPPTFLLHRRAKIPWYQHGHWNDSIPDRGGTGRPY
eukprot:Sspe_Gene.52384::Locus_29035_Transcript_2_3_Confidence_0.500_Length_1509::g.52384::m.52384